MSQKKFVSTNFGELDLVLRVSQKHRLDKVSALNTEAKFQMCERLSVLPKYVKLILSRYGSGILL